MAAIYILFYTAVCLLLLLWWYFRQHKSFKYLEKYPGPTALPFIGSALEVTTSPEVLLTKIAQYRERYGDIVKIQVGPIPNLLIVHDYKFVEFILKSTEMLNKTYEYSFLKSWLGKGLIISDGDDLWKNHRKLITSTFRMEILKKFIGGFDATNNIFIDDLRNEVGKTSTNVFPFATRCTLQTICETVMGISMDPQQQSDYIKHGKALCRVIVDRTTNPLLQFSSFYRLTPSYRTEKKAVKVLHDFTNLVINKKNAQFENTQTNCDLKDGISTTKKKVAFLDLLVQNNNNELTDNSLREELDTIMFAGHDTTASVLSFALFSLADNPEVQKKAVEELHEIFGEDRYRPISFNDLQQMKYLEAVVKETLRLYPPVPYFGRRLDKDVEYDGTILPKDLTVLINAYGIHRTPEFFPEPLKFIPERFIFDNPTTKFPYCYIPFSGGPRNCIGQKYAMLQLKSTLAKVLMHYELQQTNPRHELQVIAVASLSSKNGMSLRIIDRQW